MKLLPAALLILPGVAIGGYFIGRTMYNIEAGGNVVTVKGLTERGVEADKAYWKIEYLVTGGDKAEIPSLYDKSEIDQIQIVAFLLENGLDEKIFHPR